MEFHEKLQQLRKDRGLTQEELAQALYVSRTAVSKWESGRGYPGIDSLRDIARYFGVTVDDLLSGDALITLAEREHRDHIRRLCRLWCGVVDALSFLLIVLPLYPLPVDGYVYAVSLPAHTGAGVWAYWALFLSLTVLGATTVLLSHFRVERGRTLLTVASLCLSILAVLLLVMARQPYAVTLVFTQLIIKGGLLLKQAKNQP